MSMKLTNDILQLKLRIEHLEHHIDNVRQVTDTLTAVVERIEKEAAEDRGLVKELKTLGEQLRSLTVVKAGPRHGRGKEANG